MITDHWLYLFILKIMQQLFHQPSTEHHAQFVSEGRHPKEVDCTDCTGMKVAPCVNSS